MDETLVWSDFYGIEKTEAGFKVYDIENHCYLATCDTEAEAIKQAEKYFEGLKKIWE